LQVERPEREPELGIAIMTSAHIVGRVKLKWQSFRLALVALLVALGAGCSGIRASHSISPATFLLPGLTQTGVADPTLEKQNPQLKTDQIHASVPIVAQAQ
jgi:hypothetical protein